LHESLRTPSAASVIVCFPCTQFNAGHFQQMQILSAVVERRFSGNVTGIGPLAIGKYLIPGTPLAGEHTPEKIRQIAATLK